MLGWEFFVEIRRVDLLSIESPLIGSWLAGPSGKSWIDDLCLVGEAVKLGGDGYPFRYVLTAAALRQALRGNLSEHTGAPVLGDDYYIPRGWSGPMSLDFKRLGELPPEALLSVEAWDQS